MAEKAVMKPVEPTEPTEPTEPIETTTNSRIKVNTIYEDAKDVHVENYILYPTDDGHHLSFDETGTELIDCDALMDLCSKGVLIYGVFRGMYSKVIDFAKFEAMNVVNGTLEKYAYCNIFTEKGVATFYSKEYVPAESGEIVDDGSGKKIGDIQ